MKIKHHDIVVEKEHPFANCQLDRSQYANTLTNIVRTYADGFVLAVNSQWGTGKTTFVRMWGQQLENESFQTLYFNAWENDFESNPLVAFLAELKKLVRPGTNEQFKNLLQKGAVIVKNIAPILVKAVTDKYISTDVLKEIVIEGTKGATDILEDEIKEYTKKKDGIKEFRDSLEKFVEALGDEKPIVFVIDELDRCRPSYAVELLEQVKHFFSVKGIVFVLSIDKEQLGHAIRGAYGSDRMNADEYLRRFIDLEYTIPEPNTKTFVEHLYNYFEFDSFISSNERRRYPDFQYDRDTFIDFAIILFTNSATTLRQQEKIFAQTRLVLSLYSSNQFIFPSLLLALVFFKNLDPGFYMQLRQKKFTIEEVLPNLEQRLPKLTSDEQRRFYIHLEALLAYLYYNYIIGHRRFELLTTDNATGTSKAAIQSKFDKSENQTDFIRHLKDSLDKWDYGGITLENLLNKIELIKNTGF